MATAGEFQSHSEQARQLLTLGACLQSSISSSEEAVVVEPTSLRFEHTYDTIAFPSSSIHTNLNPPPSSCAESGFSVFTYEHVVLLEVW